MRRDYFILGALALVGIVGRIIPHPANFTPMGAAMIFGGYYFAARNQWLLLLPALFLSDLAIGLYDPKLMLVVYGSFALMGAAGLVLRHHYSPANVILGAVAGSLIFYLTTNFAVWALYPWYPHTLAGLMSSYLAGIPFFRASLSGDLFFTSAFFGSYELSRAAKRRLSPRSC